MTQIDEVITSYVTALKIEGKAPKTIDSYTNSIEDFRRVGRRLGLPGSIEEYEVGDVYQFLGALQERGAFVTSRVGLIEARARLLSAPCEFCAMASGLQKGEQSLAMIALDHQDAALTCAPGSQVLFAAL